MTEEGCPLPECSMVEEGDYRALVVVGERREFSDKFRVRLRVCCQVPLRLVKDRAKALFAAHLEDVTELCVHLVALAVRQFQPCCEQLVRLGVLHGRKIQFAEHLPCLKVTGKQGIRHLPEEVSRGVMPGHVSPSWRSVMSTPLDETGWCYTLQHVRSIDAALPLAIWLRDSCPCIYCGVDMLQSRQHISNLQHREHLLPACDYPIRQGVRHQHQRRRTIPPVARRGSDPPAAGGNDIPRNSSAHYGDSGANRHQPRQ